MKSRYLDPNCIHRRASYNVGGELLCVLIIIVFYSKGGQFPELTGRLNEYGLR